MISPQAKLTQILACVLFVSTGGACQVATPDVGVQPNRYYSGGDVDHVQMQNGLLYLDIPLASFPEVGHLSLGFSLRANGQVWEPEAGCDMYGNCVYAYGGASLGPSCILSNSGVQNIVLTNDSDLDWCYVYKFDSVNNVSYNVMYIKDSTGATHELGYDSSDFTFLHANDGSGLSMQMPYANTTANAGSPPTGMSWALIEPSGIRHTSTTTGTGGSAVYTDVVSDPAGNSITLTASATTDSYSDSTGQTIPWGPSTVSGTEGCPNLGVTGESVTRSATWQVPGTGGTPVTYLFCYTQISVLTDFFSLGGTTSWTESCSLGPDPGVPATVCTTYEEYSSSVEVLQSVVLPNVGHTFWGFVWDTTSSTHPRSYGDLLEVRMPTGGTIDYSYTPIVPCGQWIGSGPPFGRSLSQRIASSTSGASVTTNYSYNLTGGSIPSGSSANVESDADGNDTAHIYTPLASGLNCSAVETATKWYQGSQSSGTILKEEDHSYQYILDPQTDYEAANVIPTQEITKLNGTTLKTENFSYDALFADSQPQQNIYGAYGGLRFTTGTVSYATPHIVSNDISIVTTDRYSTSHSAYLAANMLSLPLATTTTDPLGTTVAETTYDYDESPSPSGTFGNLTTKSQWVSTAAGWLTSHAAYNSQGMETSATDIRGNSATTSYQCGGALPYQVTDQLSQITTYSYDCYVGLLTGVKDPNDAAASRPGTTFSYDSMRHLTSASYPDGGQLSVDYGSYANPLTITSSRLATPDPAIVTKSVYDGLGRKVQDQNYSDPVGVDYTATVYNAEDRVASVSNPYRTTSDPTYGITAFAYDALGRKIRQCQPDNGTILPCTAGTSYQQWSYSAGLTTSTDEDGNSWQRLFDGYGRLASVTEPGSLSTAYSFDPVGNLLSVNQYGNSGLGESPRVRTFTYDGLSRLVCSSNPEGTNSSVGVVSCPLSLSSSLPTSGVTLYAYPISGSVCAADASLPCSKTDPRGITLTYMYDNLSRITSKTSTTTGALANCYQYGISSTSPANGNFIGRLINEWTIPASTCGSTPPSSGIVTKRSFLLYDPMGRLRREQQCHRASCSAPFNIVTDYDLAGNQIAYTNGLKSLAFTSNFDTSGHLVNLNSSWVDGTHPGSLLSNGAYGPFGGLTGAMFGTSLNMSRSYDVRLRSTGEIVAHP